METVAIFDLCGEDDNKYLVFDGDYEYLDGTYLEAYSDTDNCQETLKDLLYEFNEAAPYDPIPIYTEITKEQFIQYIKEDAKLIMIGDIP